MVDVKKYIASCSFGKDSTAMVLKLIEHKYPLDEVVFYDTGMEFQAIYRLRDQIIPILNQNNIRYTELYPDRTFEYDMYHRPKIKRDGRCVFGDGWCGGACRWGTFLKQRKLNAYIGNNVTYIGLAADETKRLRNLELHKISPLEEWNMTEKDCLEYCFSKGYHWLEDGIELYDILDRVSCWCCRNKNLKELKGIYLNLPNYWDKLKDMQSRLCEPMKGKYSVFDLEKRFALELQREKQGLSIRNREFYDELKCLI